MPPKDAASISTIKAEKTSTTICLLGHVDCGKSTLLGHLQVDLGLIPESRLKEAKTAAREQHNRPSYCYAFLNDVTEAERSRGITLDCKLAQLETETKIVTLLDASGMRDFVKQISTNSSRSDTAILVVAATPGEFEAGIAKEGQTVEHLRLAKGLGIRRLIVFVNKFDDKSFITTTTNNNTEDHHHAKHRFEEIKSEILRILKKKIDFFHHQQDDATVERKVQFVAGSAWSGENLVHSYPTHRENDDDDESSSSSPPTHRTMTWYSGPTLVQAIDNLDRVAGLLPKLDAFPLRYTVTDLYLMKIADNDENKDDDNSPEKKIILLTGTVLSGIINVNDELIIEPNHIKARVRRLIQFKVDVQRAASSSSVAIELEDDDNEIHKNNNSDGKADDDNTNNNETEEAKQKRLEARRAFFKTNIKRGSVVGHFNSSHPPVPVDPLKGFIAKVTILNHPGRILSGYTPVIDVGTAHVAMKMEILSVGVDEKISQMDSDGKVISTSTITRFIRCSKKPKPKFIPKPSSVVTSSAAATATATAATTKNAVVEEDDDDNSRPDPELKSKMSGIVRFTPAPKKSVVVDPFDFVSGLGRFVIRDMRAVVGVGVVCSPWQCRKWAFALRLLTKEGSKIHEAFQIWNVFMNCAQFISWYDD